jgi:hypothetical protein
MIIVWNSYRGCTYGFATLEDYKKFALENEEPYTRTCWSDAVYDVGNSGCTDDVEALNLHDFNMICSEEKQ